MARKQKARKSISTVPPAVQLHQTTGTSAAGARSRLGKNKAVHIETPSHFGGHITFERETDRARYDSLLSRPIFSGRTMDHGAIATLGLTEEINSFFELPEWQRFSEINCPIFTELTREFYATFEFEMPKDFSVSTPKLIRFRLMGRVFEQSITEFNLTLGLIDSETALTREYGDSACDFSEPFRSQYVAFWRMWSTDPNPYDPSASKSSYLTAPAMRYVHRFLAYNFSGRKENASTVAKIEFFLLSCMSTGERVNLGCWIALQFRSVMLKPKKPLILGSLITHLAINLGVLSLATHNLHLAGTPQPLDLDSLYRMGLIDCIDGIYQFHTPGPYHKTPKRRRTSSGQLPESHSAGPSTPAPPAPSEILIRMEALQDEIRQQREELRQQRVDLSHMAHNFAALFQHLGFTPPFPPSA